MRLNRYLVKGKWRVLVRSNVSEPRVVIKSDDTMSMCNFKANFIFCVLLCHSNQTCIIYMRYITHGHNFQVPSCTILELSDALTNKSFILVCPVIMIIIMKRLHGGSKTVRGCRSLRRTRMTGKLILLLLNATSEFLQ